MALVGNKLNEYRVIDKFRTGIDDLHEYVLLLIIKGNLRHRIEKLGLEKTDEELNNPQYKLRRIAYEQTQPHWYVEKAYERPQWANGAFVYLSQGHARVIESAIRVSGKTLQSKHLLVSPQFKPLVKEVLEASPEGPGREAFLLRRAGVIDEEERVELGQIWMTRLSGSGVNSIDEDTVASSADDVSECSTAVSSVTPALRSDASTVCPEDVYYDRRMKNIHLVQLDASIMNERDIDFDLLEYLTSPTSVQRLNPDMWLAAWEHVCSENKFWR